MGFTVCLLSKWVVDNYAACCCSHYIMADILVSLKDHDGALLCKKIQDRGKEHA